MLSEKLLEFSLVGAEWVLWLLVALSVFSIALMIDRLALYIRTRERLHSLAPSLLLTLKDRDYVAALDVVSGDSFIRNVLRSGLRLLADGVRDVGTVEQAMRGAHAHERARYGARLTPLGTIGNNAPFVGLFGTVLGIIQAFHQLGHMDPSAGATNRFVMQALGSALVATGVGIIVAIPAVAAFNAAKAHVGARSKQAESLMGTLLAGVHTPGGAERAGGAQGGG